MEKIINEYLNGASIEKLCSEFKMGKKTIKKILTENEVKIRKKGGQVKNFKIDYKSDYSECSVSCKKCGKIFNDPTNRSGSLIEHIKKCYPDVSIPTKFKRNAFKNTTGVYWHMDYFNLIEKNVKHLTCPICNWVTKDLINKSGSLTKHVKKKHGSIDDFLSNNQEYKKYFNITNKKLNRKNVLKNDYVECKICGKSMLQINNTHLKKHNITVEEYKLIYPNNKMVSNSTSEKLRNQQIINNINITPSWTSKGEIEINKFINDLGFITEKGKNRKLLNGKEIDIIIEEKKICIEYNGLYYHTENMGKHPSYHLNKTIECNLLGYRLIHIFEDEWVNRNEIVKSKISHILGVSNKLKIGARKVNIKLIDSKTKNDFLNKHHIQEKDDSKIYLGSYYNNILVGVMTFNNFRKMTKNNINEYEMSRFATHIDYVIYGLATKMLKYFIKEFKPSSIISFADRRWSCPNNNVYINMGFKLISILPPDYRYYNSKVNKYKRYHKFNFGKTNLTKKYSNLDMNKSERELTSELGFDRIWDCGLLKYQYIIS